MISEKRTGIYKVDIFVFSSDKNVKHEAYTGSFEKTYALSDVKKHMKEFFNDTLNRPDVNFGIFEKILCAMKVKVKKTGEENYICRSRWDFVDWVKEMKP